MKRRHKYIKKERIDDMVKLIIHGDDADIIPSCGKICASWKKNCALRKIICAVRNCNTMYAVISKMLKAQFTVNCCKFTISET
jgi:hypothetical protein